jgi:hypothetical protein
LLSHTILFAHKGVIKEILSSFRFTPLVSHYLQTLNVVLVLLFAGAATAFCLLAHTILFSQKAVKLTERSKGEFSTVARLLQQDIRRFFPWKREASQYQFPKPNLSTTKCM